MYDVVIRQYSIAVSLHPAFLVLIPTIKKEYNMKSWLLAVEGRKDIADMFFAFVHSAGVFYDFSVSPIDPLRTPL